MSSLSEDVSFRVRLELDTSDYNAALISYKNKRLDVLKLQSAHDTSGNTSSDDAEESAELSSKVASFITYFIRKVYVGSNLSTNSSSISSKRLDRETDLNHFKILIQSHAPELEEACLVYHVTGDANSFAEIRRGFQNAEAASNSTVKVALCANEPDDNLPIMPNGMDTNNVGSGEVIDFVFSVKYGYRPGVSKLTPMKIDTGEESQDVNEEADRDEVDDEEGSEEDIEEEEDSEEASEEENERLGSDKVDDDEEGSEVEEDTEEESQEVNEGLDSDKVDDDEEGSEEEDSDEVVSEEESSEIGNDNSNELESTDGSQCTKLNNSEEAGSTTIYPSE